MSIRDAREDWRRFDAERIPSKASTPQLDSFLAGLPATDRKGPPLALLDVGCGTGRLSRQLYDRGFSVLGVDVNADAVGIARKSAVSADATGRRLRFEEADVSSNHGPRLDGGPFDVVVCQLVISIIGAVPQRMNLLRHVRRALRPGGWLYLSASGVSDTINAAYARLYDEDFPLTGERHTYLSRDDRCEILYMTHHFTVEELTGLLETAGFGRISITTEQESSSRRPDEAAFFHYATCKAGHVKIV